MVNQSRYDCTHGDPCQQGKLDLRLTLAFRVHHLQRKVTVVEVPRSNGIAACPKETTSILPMRPNRRGSIPFSLAAIVDLSDDPIISNDLNGIHHLNQGGSSLRLPGTRSSVNRSFG